MSALLSPAVAGLSYDNKLFNRVTDTTDITVSGTSWAAPTNIGQAFNVTFPASGTFEVCPIQMVLNCASGADLLLGVSIGGTVVPFYPQAGNDAVAAGNYPVCLSVAAGATVTYAGGYGAFPVIEQTVLGNIPVHSERVAVLDIAALGIGGATRSCQFVGVKIGGSPIVKGTTTNRPTTFGWRIGQ